MAVSAATIAGTLKGTTLEGGEAFHGDMIVLTAIGLAQQARGDLTREGWWGTKYADLPQAAQVLLVIHQDAKQTDPAVHVAAYTTGAYVPYMAEATAAVASAAKIDNKLENPAKQSPAGQAVESVTDKLSTFADLAAWLGDRHNWLRVLYVAGGLSMVIIGFLVMFRRDITSAVQAVNPL